MSYKFLTPGEHKLNNDLANKWIIEHRYDQNDFFLSSRKHFYVVVYGSLATSLMKVKHSIVPMC